jgi:hypothetical protein
MPHNRLGHAAQQHAWNAMAPVTADYDQIRRPFLGRIHNLMRWFTHANEFQSRRSWQQGLEFGHNPPSIPFGLGDQLLGRKSRSMRQRRLDSMDESHLSADTTSKPNANFSGMRGHRLTIDCDEDSFEVWGHALIRTFFPRHFAGCRNT